MTEYEIGMGCLGDGLTFWNKLELKNGSYMNIAHISSNCVLSLYVENLPEEVSRLVKDEHLKMRVNNAIREFKQLNIAFFLVRGESDKTALETIISKLRGDGFDVGETVTIDNKSVIFNPVFYSERLERISVPITPSRKASLTREINKITEELEDRERFQKQGHNLYLGDPIGPQIRSLQKELVGLKKERADLDSPKTLKL